MMKSIIQIKNMSVIYDKGKVNEMTALKDITLDIFEGEYIVFLGQSGCGKSTLLYTIAGLESPASGRVSVGGYDLVSMDAKQKIDFYRNTIGMIFQAFYLVPHLTARDNIILAKMFLGAAEEERSRKADSLIKKFGIDSFRDRKPSMLSGGQMQRTAIARALMNDPSIILADEPVGNLDSKNAAVVLELLARIHKEEKKTVIQVTHNANDARYADRVFYMKDGNIERVVANTERGRMAMGESQPTSEFDKLSRANPNLSDYELSSMLIMRQALGLYDLDTEMHIRKSIEKYIRGETDKMGLQRELSDKDSGAGLYSQKAEHISRDVANIFDQIKMAVSAGKGEDVEKVPDEEAKGILEFVLKGYKGKISPYQAESFKEAIISRLAGKVDENGLREVLDLPEKQGGVGLNSRTAKRLAEEIEAIIPK